MEIVVHGTKGGRQIFTPKKLGGLLDVNADTSKASAIGKEAYAIRFIEKTIIFSKYKIIRDVRGDKRTGFLAFSLFLPNNKKLYGSDILSALNKVSEEYCKKYIPENDNNLKDVREDWAFLDRIAEQYKAMLRPVSSEDIESLLSGSKDDAFICYENDEKLQKYLDAPYQDEYSQYRQVLFVKKELKDKPEDPLNALRHSEDNLTGNIDLENPKYKLLFNQTAKGGVRIDVKVNNITRSSRSKIRLKDELEISWSKQFCETVTKRGKWNEISNEFIDVNSSAESVSVKEIMPPDKTKTITFNIKDWQKTPVNGAKIICKNAGGEILPIENYSQANFKGDDLGKRWRVSANNDRFFSEERPIDFDRDCPGDTGNVDIVLNKHKLNKQQVTVNDESNGDILNGFTLSKTEFTGSEIKETHRITVSCFEYESKSFTYCPASAIYLEPIKLKKKQYSSGTKTINSEIGSPDNYGTLKGDKIFSQNKKNEPFYQRPKFIAGTIVGSIIICISIGIWIMYEEKKEVQFEQPQQNAYQYIQTYIEGNSLILDTLKKYKNSQTIEPKSVSNSLESAIKKREFINSWNFDTLKKLHYYPAQQNFHTTIKKINSPQYYAVKSRFGDISSWTLDQIADSIKTVLNTTKPAAENKPETKKEVNEEKKGESKKEVIQPAKPEQKKEKKLVSPAAKMDKTTEIIQYLKGDELKKEVLNKYLKEAGNNAALIKSIRLCLSLWILNGQKNNDYCSVYRNCAKDNNLKETNITKILKTLCDKTDVNYAGLSNATDILSKLKTKK